MPGSQHLSQTDHGGRPSGWPLSFIPPQTASDFVTVKIPEALHFGFAVAHESVTVAPYDAGPIRTCRSRRQEEIICTA